MVEHTVVVGLQWGDEGKGKLVDILADSHDWIVRYGGGDNAGHTVVIDGKKYAFHLLPSGVLHPDKNCVLGNGMVVNPSVLLNEIKCLPENHAKIYLSDRAHVVLPKHIIEDAEKERIHNIGTTKRGIGPAYADKISRKGFRFCDFVGAEADELRHYICDTRLILQSALEKGERILFEGAQATLLDIDHGTYPFVTSSSTSIGGVYTGTGIRPKDLKVIGIAKAYSTRVGGGPFPTEQMNDVGKYLQESGVEVGTTTGRKRRCGFFDAVAAKYCAEVNGVDEIALTKLDVLSGLDELLVCDYYYKIRLDYNPDNKFCTMPASISKLQECIPHYVLMKGWKDDISKAKSFEDLPREAQDYVAFIQDFLRAPITFIGVGSDRKQIIKRPSGSKT